MSSKIRTMTNFWIIALTSIVYGTIINHHHQTFALTIDNQLVSARNDCFERIALGAMLPFEKTFRNEETNSLKLCQDFCLRDGEKCQTIAFGVHVRGNGTCQLSSSKIDATQTRPAGTIFDPDFDLYAKKIDCFNINENDPTIPTPGGLDTVFPPTNNNQNDQPTSPSRPRPLPFGPTYSLPPSSSGRPTTSATPIMTDDTPDDRYSTPNFSRYPTSGYGVSENTDNTQTFGASYPTRDPPPTTFSGHHRPSYSSNHPNSDVPIYYSHESYPLYKYPMLYEQNYPMPNDPSTTIPAIYAQNVPTVDVNYRPTYSYQGSDIQRTTPKPVYGLGYGTGYSYGTPVKYNPRPTTTPSSDTRPQYVYGSQPTSSYDPGNQQALNQPRPSNSYNDRPTDYHSNRPSSQPVYVSDSRPQQYDTAYNTEPNRPYSPRPDPTYDTSRPTVHDSTSYGTSGNGASRPSSSSNAYGQSQGTTVRPLLPSTSHTGYADPGPGNSPSRPNQQDGGNYHVTEHPIETYFNPDDYYQTSWTLKPGCGTPGSNCDGVDRNRYPQSYSFTQQDWRLTEGCLNLQMYKSP